MQQTSIVIAETEQDYRAASLLFSQYAEWLGIDLCFQGFEQELQTLPEMYGAPAGAIFLCRENEQYIGCVAVRPIGEGIAELKRMYVLPEQQRKGIGRALLVRALSFAREAGYRSVRLDTLNRMIPAINLYREFGFKPIEAYYHNPEEGVLYFGLDL